jgi:hypothetical protein
VKRAHKNLQKKVKTETEDDQAEEGDSKELSQVDEEFDDEDDGADDYVIKERKYNYYSEFSGFVDYQTIQKMLNLIRGEKMVWNHKRINQGVYNYIYRIVNDLAGEWIFFQMDFLSCFNEILQNEMIIFKKEHSQFVELIRKIVKSFFRHLQKNSLLTVESIFRFSDLATKDRILNNYDFLQSIRQIEENEPVINKTVIPWSKEEDLILIENFEFYKTDKDPWLSLSNLLRDQAFFRDKKEVKFRVKLIKLDKSKDIALQLIEGAYTKKFSLEEVVVRMLLYSHSNGRSTELHFLNYLKEIREEYKLYKKTFTMTEVPMAVVPTNAQHFEFLEYSFVPSVFEFFNFEKPRYGFIYWRVPNRISSDMLDSVIEAFITLYECIKDKTEAELLEMGDKEYLVHNTKARKVSEKKPKKRSSKAEERRLKREEAFKNNKELAELMDSDEELSLESEESSDQLDYEVVPIRRKNVETKTENFEEDRGQDSDNKMEIELENGVKKHRRLKKNTGAEMDEDE